MNLVLPYIKRDVAHAVHLGPAVNRRGHLWELWLSCGHRTERPWWQRRPPVSQVFCYECGKRQD